MIYSMTGYGKGVAEGKGLIAEVEANSVNSRYLEVKFKIPAYLSPIEHRLRAIVLEKVSRGKINLFVNLISTGPEFKPSRIDVDAAIRFREEISKLNTKLGIPDQVDVDTLLGIPDVIVSGYSGEEIEALYQVVSEALKRALNELIASRQKEGESLLADFEHRVGLINSAVTSIECLAPGNNERQFKRLKEKLSSIVNETEIDESRLIQEAGLLADRYDITEEIVRLKSHLENLSSDLKRGGTVGKRMNFILQEMGREANTIGAKSNETEIVALVINIKEEMEKIREQAANIE